MVIYGNETIKYSKMWITQNKTKRNNKESVEKISTFPLTFFVFLFLFGFFSSEGNLKNDKRDQQKERTLIDIYSKIKNIQKWNE